MGATDLLSFSMSFHHVITSPPSRRSLASTSPSTGSSVVCARPITGSETSSNACLGVSPCEQSERMRSRSARTILSRLGLSRECLSYTHEYALMSESV